jgi:hypothetical protein
LYTEVIRFEGIARRSSGTINLLAQHHYEHIKKYKCENLDDYIKDIDLIKFPEIQMYKRFFLYYVNNDKNRTVFVPKFCDGRHIVLQELDSGENLENSNPSTVLVHEP